MNRKDTYGIYNNTAEHISLLKYSKSSCGVDFLLNTAESTEKRGWFDTDKRYRTDFFEFYSSAKQRGISFWQANGLNCIPICGSSFRLSSCRNGTWSWTSWIICSLSFRRSL